jgi:hypothetical protein
LFRRGTAIEFFSSSSFNSAGATSFSNFARSRGRSLALWCACAGAFCSCAESFEPFFSLSFAIDLFQLPLTVRIAEAVSFQLSVPDPCVYRFVRLKIAQSLPAFHKLKLMAES